MKKISSILAAILLIAGSSLLLGQEVKLTPNSSTSIEGTLIQIEKDLSRAAVKKDIAVFESSISETCTVTDHEGKVTDRKKLIELIKSPEFTMVSSKLDNFKIKVYRDTAVVNYKSSDIVVFKGEQSESESRWTDTFVKQNSKWMEVASHESRIPQ